MSIMDDPSNFKTYHQAFCHISTAELKSLFEKQDPELNLRISLQRVHKVRHLVLFLKINI
jgi:hypothetical protein